MGCISIDKEANGYTVSMTDPKIEAANRKADIKREGTWRNPRLTYVFQSWKAVMAFVEKNGEKAFGPEDFDSSFDMVAGGDD